MLKRQARNSEERLHQANKQFLEHQHFEIVREVYQTIHMSGLGKFTFSVIDSLWNHLSVVLHHLDKLPEVTFMEWMEVIDDLGEARNELRHARFLFDVKEINPVHRLVMRNRAVLRGKDLLHKVLLVWPSR